MSDHVNHWACAVCPLMAKFNYGGKPKWGKFALGYMSDEAGSQGEEKNQERENQAPNEGRRRPPWMQSRLGTGLSDGAKAVEHEDIPDALIDDPLFWYGRYLELEKSYQDLGAILQDQRRKQQQQSFMRDTRKGDLEAFYDRARSIVGIFTGTLVILQLTNAEGIIQVSPEILIGSAIAITTVLDAISLPSFLSRVKNTIRDLWSQGDSN